jgi:cobalt/nickel transport system permease protein
VIGSFFDASQGTAQRKMISSDRKRILGLLILLCISASVTNFIPAVVMGSAVLGLCLWAGVSWKYISVRLTLLLPFGLIAILLLPFTIPGKEIETVLGWVISKEGIILAGLLVTKLIICHFIICLMLATTPSSNLLRALCGLGLPQVIIEIMTVTLRYLSVLFEEIERMILAQKSRGLTIGSFASWSSYKRCGELLGVLLIRSYERSQRIYDAKLARGFGNQLTIEGEDDHESHSNRKPILPISRFD